MFRLFSKNRVNKEKEKDKENETAVNEEPEDATPEEDNDAVVDPPKEAMIPSDSFETVETEGESDDLNESEDSAAGPQEMQQKARLIRWSDEEGGKLRNIRLFEPLEEATIRLVLLLIDPVDRKFEFVHCEFDTEERLTVKDTIRQIPRLAGNPIFVRRVYSAICRDSCEMINMFSLQDYKLENGEVLVCVPVGAAPREICAMSSELLEDKALRKAVRRARICGRALQRLKSTEMLASPEPKKQESSKPKKKDVFYDYLSEPDTRGKGKAIDPELDKKVENKELKGKASKKDKKKKKEKKLKKKRKRQQKSGDGASTNAEPTDSSAPITNEGSEQDETPSTEIDVEVDDSDSCASADDAGDSSEDEAEQEKAEPCSATVVDDMVNLDRTIIFEQADSADSRKDEEAGMDKENLEKEDLLSTESEIVATITGDSVNADGVPSSAQHEEPQSCNQQPAADEESLVSAVSVVSAICSIVQDSETVPDDESSEPDISLGDLVSMTATLSPVIADQASPTSVMSTNWDSFPEIPNLDDLEGETCSGSSSADTVATRSLLSPEAEERRQGILQEAAMRDEGKASWARTGANEEDDPSFEDCPVLEEDVSEIFRTASSTGKPQGIKLDDSGDSHDFELPCRSLLFDTLGKGVMVTVAVLCALATSSAAQRKS